MMTTLFLVVNGVIFPSPEQASVEYENIGSMNRAIDGTLVSDIVATKVHLKCRFPILEDRLLRTILEATQPKLVRVFFRNPMNANSMNVEMFAHVSPGSNFFVKNDVMWWKDVECAFIEQ